MAKTAKHSPLDPTLPKASVTLDGVTYHLCFTFAALILAEAKLREQGVIVNLIEALDLNSLDATKVVPLVYAALVTHQPDTTFEDAAKLVTLRHFAALRLSLYEAFVESMAEPDKDATTVPLA